MEVLYTSGVLWNKLLNAHTFVIIRAMKIKVQVICAKMNKLFTVTSESLTVLNLRYPSTTNNKRKDSSVEASTITKSVIPAPEKSVFSSLRRLSSV